MSETRIEDLDRAPGTRTPGADKRCRVCGYPVYVLWIEGDPPDTCIEAKSDPMECGEAIRRLDTEVAFTRLREAGLIKVCARIARSAKSRSCN